MKEEPIADPNIYLGGKVRKHEYQTKDRIKKFWSFSSSQYVQNACSNVLKHLKQETRPGFKITKKDNRSPISSGYCPKLDDTEELSLEDASHYHSLIGIFW